MDSKTAFLKFLSDQEIDIDDIVSDGNLNIEELVEANFDKMNEVVLRSLAQYAMKEYSSGGTGGGGIWMPIIDAVRSVTTTKRTNAETNLMSLLNYCSSLPSVSSSNSSNSTSTSTSKLTQDKALMIKKCKEMYASGVVDKVFMELLMNTRDGFFTNFLL